MTCEGLWYSMESEEEGKKKNSDENRDAKYLESPWKSVDLPNRMEKVACKRLKYWCVTCILTLKVNKNLPKLIIKWEGEVGLLWNHFKYCFSNSAVQILLCWEREPEWSPILKDSKVEENYC